MTPRKNEKQLTSKWQQLDKYLSSGQKYFSDFQTVYFQIHCQLLQNTINFPIFYFPCELLGQLNLSILLKYFFEIHFLFYSILEDKYFLRLIYHPDN